MVISDESKVNCVPRLVGVAVGEDGEGCLCAFVDSFPISVV